MESMNKFKVLTVLIVCMFLFVIAAIYSNTKDAATSKTLPTQKTLSTDNNQKAESVRNDSSVEYLETQLEILNKRVDELSQRGSSSSEGANCKVIGVSTPDGILRLSQVAAIEEAKTNDYEIVVSCSF